MHCTGCGVEISEGINFCANCGMNLGADGARTTTAVMEPPAPPAIDNSTPLLVARPTFIPWVALAGIIPLQIFMTIWGAGFCGGFGMFAVQALGLNLPAWFTFVFFGVLFFFGLPLLVYFAAKRTYAQTEYRFYPDRLEYAEGFWTAEQKSIKYRDIKEVHLSRGLVQRRYDLGTIQLSTASASALQSSNRSFSGIRVHDIPHAPDVYQKVKELIG